MLLSEITETITSLKTEISGLTRVIWRRNLMSQITRYEIRLYGVKVGQFSICPAFTQVEDLDMCKYGTSFYWLARAHVM